MTEPQDQRSTTELAAMLAEGLCDHCEPESTICWNCCQAAATRLLELEQKIAMLAARLEVSRDAVAALVKGISVAAGVTQGQAEGEP